MKHLSRRTFLRASSAATAGLAMSPVAASPAAALQPLPQVAPLDPAQISLADFTGLEQQIAPYLGLLADLANSVEDTDPETYGFIDCGCWRVPSDVPQNARVQENCLTLAYFYSANRPWNPYYGDAALRQRLEAALTYWVSLQSTDGGFPQAFPESVQINDRAATAFALEFVGLRTPDILDQGPSIDTAVYDSVIAAAQRAAQWFLIADSVWGVNVQHLWANQVMAGMVAISGLLPRFNDPDLTEQFRTRAVQMEGYQQGPAGFFRDGGAVAHRYSIAVQSRDMAVWADSQTQPIIDRMQQNYLDWLQYNAIYDAAAGGFFVNNAIDSRHPCANHFFTEKIGANNLWTADLGPARAFSPTAEDVTAAREQWRNSSWDAAVAPLIPGVAMSMTPAVIRDLVVADEHYPARSQRNAARGALRPLTASSFTEFRSDDEAAEQEFVFAKREPYLLGLSFGNHQQYDVARFGLNYLWHDTMGMVIHSQGGRASGDPSTRPPAAEVVWGTARNGPDGFGIDAFEKPSATYIVNGEPVDDPTTIGPNQAFTVRYAPTTRSWLQKSVDVGGSQLRVTATASGAFWEQIPLVLGPTDVVQWLGADGEVQVHYATDVAEQTATGIRVMRNGNLSGASGTSYVDTPIGGTPEQGQVTFTLDVERGGDFALWGRARGMSSSADSFIVRVDGSGPIHWHLQPGGGWQWNRVTRGAARSAEVFTLSPGTHSVTVQVREPGARLDLLLLTPDVDDDHPYAGCRGKIMRQADSGTVQAPMRVVTADPPPASDKGTLEISWAEPRPVSFMTTDVGMFHGARHIHMLKIPTTDQLVYEINV